MTLFQVKYLSQQIIKKKRPKNTHSHTLLCTLDNQEHFIRRLPLVHTALKAYENSSSVVKYGAEMIESYAGPIYDKLGYDRKLKEVNVV